MKPVYLDLHIHTSENPNELNTNYNLDVLLSKVFKSSQGNNFLISLTDHDTINKKAYLELYKKIQSDYKGSNLILGAELHIRKYSQDENTKAYHCHIFFDVDITEEKINKLNNKLDILYPNKRPENKDKKIPLIEEVLDTFDKYDFLLLPHGSQAHSTFHNTVRGSSGNKNFDNTLYRSLYYNFFDGFTARSNIGVEGVKAYFKKIGIEEFTGLVTSSDNYSPEKYPNAKSLSASEFIPTWMFAIPNFDGLRISLSDSTRLSYSKVKPKTWESSIKQVSLNEKGIDITASFTAGLNVIIGGSSSGKTLLADSMVRKLLNKPFSEKEDENSVYNKKYLVENIEVECPSGIKPYYIHQNYISHILNTHGNIAEIEPLNILFPDTTEQRKYLATALAELQKKIESLFNAVEKIEKIEKSIKNIPVLNLLITTKKTVTNPVTNLLQISSDAHSDLLYDKIDYNSEAEILDSIHERLIKHPILKGDKKSYESLSSKLKLVREFFLLHEKIYKYIKKYKGKIDKSLQEKLGKEQESKTNFDILISEMKQYHKLLNRFGMLIVEIASFNRVYKTSFKNINGHKLFFEGSIELNNKIISTAFNEYLLSNKKIPDDFSKIMPQNLFSFNFSKKQPSNPTGAVPQYSTITNNIYNFISTKNKTKARIKTKTDEDFENLSPGKQTAVILDLVLNYDGDNVPIIIDQPEDNLSSAYMNTELVELIKIKKSAKQIIFVSHSATIPMIGDAQNIILCENNNGKIKIISAPLEGKLNDKKIVDYIAEITDGGKQSVKKRFKKYNLKKFKK